MIDNGYVIEIKDVIALVTDGSHGPSEHMPALQLWVYSPHTFHEVILLARKMQMRRSVQWKDHVRWNKQHVIYAAGCVLPLLQDPRPPISIDYEEKSKAHDRRNKA